jgi:hypothetical protein
VNAAINEVMSDPAAREYLTKLGLRLTPRTVADTQAI